MDLADQISIRNGKGVRDRTLADNWRRAGRAIAEVEPGDREYWEA